MLRAGAKQGKKIKGAFTSEKSGEAGAHHRGQVH